MRRFLATRSSFRLTEVSSLLLWRWSDALLPFRLHITEHELACEILGFVCQWQHCLELSKTCLEVISQMGADAQLALGKSVSLGNEGALVARR